MAKTTRPRKASPNPAPTTAVEREPMGIAPPKWLTEDQAAVVDQESVLVETPPEVLADMERDADEQATASRPVSKPRKNPRLCPVVDCDRLGHDHLLGMCGAHYASRRGDHV